MNVPFVISNKTVIQNIVYNINNIISFTGQAGKIYDDINSNTIMIVEYFRTNKMSLNTDLDVDVHNEIYLNSHDIRFKIKNNEESNRYALVYYSDEIQFGHGVDYRTVITFSTLLLKDLNSVFDYLSKLNNTITQYIEYPELSDLLNCMSQ